MDITHNYWEDNSNIQQRVKYESNSNDDPSRLKDDRGLFTCCETNLNFSTATCSEDDCEYGTFKKNKVTRQDPMSHRIIEKRRRDRMNNCLADLSRLIPTEYLKKGRGRIEKTEIIEMAIKHMKYLQQDHGSTSDNYRLGYQECMSEAMRFMVEVEGHFPREAICVRLLNHLQKHCESLSHSSAASNDNTMENANNLQANGHDRIRSLPQLVPNSDYPSHHPKTEEPNNNHNGPAVLLEHFHTDTTYKYKTNIKMRFNQDEGELNRKRQKRHSITSTENQSSSRSSPPSSEPCHRISDSETTNHRQSPTSDSAISVSTPLKVEPTLPHHVMHPGHFPLHSKTAQAMDLKQNFNIPIFVLHAKGSYYVPLTIDYKTLLPFLHNYDILEIAPEIHSFVLHPVTINVNFHPSNHFPNDLSLSNRYKNDFTTNGWH